MESAAVARYHGGMHRTLITALALMLLAGSAAAEVPTGARELFDRYQARERQFDPALAQLYDDDAVILVTRIYSNGVVRHLKIPGDLYKLALRESMDEAAEQGDFNQYNDVQFSAENGRVQVSATRYNLWRHYTSPYSATLERGADGWRIIEERFETQVPYPATE